MLLKRHAALWIAAIALMCTLLTAVEADAREMVHTVQKGQNLGMIARRYHTTAKAIQAHNGLKKGRNIHPGQKLRIVEVEEHARWRRHVERKKAPKPKKKAAKKSAPQKKIAKKKNARDKTEKRKSKAGAKATAKRKGKPSKPTAAKKSRRKKPSEPTDPYARKPRRPGWIQIVRQGEKFRGTLVGSNGRVVAKNSKRLDRLLRSRRTGKKHRINRRLLKLLTQVSDHFGSRTIIVVSGYRPVSKKQFTRNSRHNHGAAIDFRIVGVPNHALFAYCKRFRRVGCGLYPNSHFVHMDVRKNKTEWVDYSRPGQRPVYAHHKKRKQQQRKRKPRPREKLARRSTPEREPKQRKAGQLEKPKQSEPSAAEKTEAPSQPQSQPQLPPANPTALGASAAGGRP